MALEPKDVGSSESTDANGKAAKILGWATTTVMAVAAIAVFATGSVSL